MVSFGAFAQQMMPPNQAAPADISDEDIEAFVDLNKKIMPKQEAMQQKMVAKIEEEGMDIMRFQQIAQAQEQGKLSEVAKDEEEMATFNKVGQMVMKMQEELQGEVMKMIEDSELGQQKFQMIFMAYQQDPEVRDKVEKMMAEDEG
ncbi:hypothetical protein A3SI_17057 [Nitritalea halalkaliphila LW7]|uniref:DUF4168 domain-containing protein n=1 Tax=Nitritalea halalkaliphila LW7 TaxID=1189621 RepID=I5BWE6_9BACT|nr:DUF4168 domain-containing protein [Nitritalea halalkaliphila]EIM73898.1 hypothetical protein A3SI_17057 [Nitritalea halalkaliphila LW7]